MPNRFISAVEAGEISSEAELKSAFRALALATHPDLGGEGGRGESFVKVRAEYEAALRYLADSGGRAGRGARRGAGFAGRDGGPGEAEGEGRAAAEGRRGTSRGRSFDRALFYADLSALLKAGFPKTPRHDKERRKYARLRLLLRSSLAARGESPSPLGLFDDFERALSRLKDSPEGAGTSAAAVLGLLSDLVEYEETGIVALRSVIEIELAGLRAGAARAAAAPVGAGGEWARYEEDESSARLFGFLSFLVADMEGGPALG
jgi:curved DNA-binding protein CbpA